jgi:hypothetical protein
MDGNCVNCVYTVVRNKQTKVANHQFDLLDFNIKIRTSLVE